MATSKTLGGAPCPLCGGSAAIHEVTKGSRKGALYFRCYERLGSTAAICGTGQLHGPVAQHLMSQQLGPLDHYFRADGTPLLPPKITPNQVLAKQADQVADFTPEPAPANDPAPSKPDPVPAPAADPEPAPAPAPKKGWSFLGTDPDED